MGDSPVNAMLVVLVYNMESMEHGSESWTTDLISGLGPRAGPYQLSIFSSLRCWLVPRLRMSPGNQSRNQRLADQRDENVST